MIKRIMILFALCLTLSFAHAQEAPPSAETPPSDATDDANVDPAEQEFDSSLRELAELTGQAFACLSGEALEKHEDRAQEIFRRIIELFGSDRAFVFAVTYGHSAGEESEADKCPETIELQS